MANVGVALRTVLDPQASEAAKQQCQRELDGFKASEAGLRWAVQCLDSASAVDEPSLWLASDIVLSWAKFRAAAADGQGLLRQRLWAWLRGGALPHFVQAKLAAALACLAVACWPQSYPGFWPDLQQCLAAQQGVALRVLGCLLEEFQAAAQATSAGFRGRVLSSQIPGIQARYTELLPAAVSLLASLLRSAQPGLAAAAQQGSLAELSLALESLKTLRKAVADLPGRLQEQHPEAAIPALLELLFSYAQALDLAQPGAQAHGACQELAAAAMDCAADLLAKPQPPQQAQKTLELLLAQLPGCLAAVQRHWERCGMRVAQEDPALAALAHLLSQFATTQLGRAEAAGQLVALQGVLGLLGQVSVLMFTRRSPVDVLVLGEVWHAVLDHRESLDAEDGGWGEEEEGTSGAQASPDPYKAALLHMAHLLLGTLCSPSSPLPLPGLAAPFLAAQLDGSEGSGAALEDWVQSVASGGEAEEGEEAEAEGAEGELDQGEVLVPGTRQYAASLLPSEREVYCRQAEGLVSRVVSSYSTHMLPLLLRCLAQHSSAFAQACSQLAAAAAGQPHGPAAAGLQGLQPAVEEASRDLEVSLRLVARCGASLPLRGLGEQASLADLAMPAGPGAPPAVSGAHAAAVYSLLLDLASGWQQTAQAVAGSPGASALLSALAPVGARIFRTLGALTATWLSRLMLTQLPAGGAGAGEPAALVGRLTHGTLAAPAQLLGALGAGACQLDACEGALREPALAAAEALVPLTSIALSSSMRPPAELLLGLLGSSAYQTLQQLSAQALPSTHIPTRALRALWIALSDLSLRSWSAQPATTFPAEARATHFAGVAAPLAQCFAELARNIDSGHSAHSTVDTGVRRAAAVANGLVLSFAGTPKHVRGILYSALVSQLLPPTLSLLRHCAQAHQGAGTRAALGGKAGAALLRLLGSVIEVVALELGAAGLEQLLGSLVETFSAGGGDPTLESDLALLRLLCNVMGQGGNKHQALLLPSLQFCFGVWQRAGAAAGRDVDSGHVKAVALASLLTVLRHRWRQLSGATVQALAFPSAGSAALDSTPSGGPGPLALLHQELQQAAAAGGFNGGAAGAASGVGAAAIAQALALLQEYLAGAAGGQAVLAAADVRLVLEELYELQVVARLYASPLFQPVREPVLASLLAMLLSRLYTAAQNDLVDTLFSVAAANWSEFHLSFLPRFAEARLGRLGPSERGSLLELFGSADLDAPTFERQALAFVNDVLFYEAAAGGAAGA